MKIENLDYSRNFWYNAESREVIFKKKKYKKFD